MAATPATAQALHGRVMQGDTGVGGVPVTLHRVTRDSAGAVATVAAAPDGSFAFTLPRSDTAGFNVFFATAEFRGVRYFGPPLHRDDPVTGYTVAVFDTASAESARAAVQVARRDVVLLPEEDGSAEVNELVRLRNPGDRTLVVGSGVSTWEFRLPEGVAAFEVGEGEIAPSMVQRRGNRVLVTASLTPGDHELFVRYRLGRGAVRTVFPLAAGTDSMSLFIRQPSAQATVAALQGPGPVEADGERFLRYDGGGLGSREAVVVQWKRAALPPVDPRVAALLVTGLVLTAGAGLAARRSPRSPAP
ncbi:MAG TPA: hypothetical protein VHG28_21755 [Longimicrobiaceae bacterium]|nr:hypothetical protein [Longimicrobiaceae bacterium]